MTSSLHTQEITDNKGGLRLVRRLLGVEVKKGPDRNLRREFDGDRILVGTHESCDLVLADATISRQHCEIALVEGGYAVRDLDSTNGTFLGPARIGEIVVGEPVLLRVGHTSLWVGPLAETVEIPLEDSTQFGALLGASAAMRRVFASLKRVAPTDATVLITGESGTGKELAARGLHEQSPRAGGRFQVVDCAALAGSLIESELFGHERGAFTGALQSRKGAFEAASGGTVFLDEIGEMPLELQARLLGAIERRRVRPIGGQREIGFDVRIVAATNRDLRREVNRGCFREDLYFRLAVVTVQMPPLRERPEDIALYVEEFVREVAAERPGFCIDPTSLARLQDQPWPGNVRELRNALERMAALGEVEMPAAQSPPAGRVDVSIPFKVAKAALVEGWERTYVTELLGAHGGNITRAARAAGIDRVYFLRLLDKYGLRPGRSR